MSVDHYENFPVASVLCPPRLRPPIVAIYRFARTADDLADEGVATAVARLQDLAAFRADLSAVLSGRDPGSRWRALFAELGRQARAHALPAAPLHALLDAFEQDVRNPTYADRAALLDYCRRSANPVGRLLLHLWGLSDEASERQSDAICTALQLINFWQDLGRDVGRGRHYVPLADALAHGITHADLQTGIDSARSRHLVGTLCDWAGGLMQAGAPLALRVPGRAGWELRLVVEGGRRVLAKMRAMDHATLARRPRLSAADVPLLLWRAARMRGDPA